MTHHRSPALVTTGHSHVLLIAVLMLLPSLALSADAHTQLKIQTTSTDQLALLAERFGHLRHDPATGVVVVDSRPEDRDWLSHQGLDILSSRALPWHGDSPDRRSTSGSGIPGYGCYRTVEETMADAAALANNHPGLASWIDVGDSWQKSVNNAGYDIHALVLTNSAIGGDKPPLLITGGIHAREYTSAELVTRFGEQLVAGHGHDPDATWLLDHHQIHLMLQTNPDGRKNAETGLSWRKNVNATTCTTVQDQGIDLNRNFPFQWGCCGGSSGDGCSTTYRGDAASSEPETQAIESYMTSLFADQRPDDLVTPAPDDAVGTYIDVHSFGEVILSSWGFTSSNPPNADGILRLARKWGHLNGYRPQLGSLGTVDGATKDAAYGLFGVPGYTFELGTAFFEDCDYFETRIMPQNLSALRYAAKASRLPYLLPAGPDIEGLPTVLPPVAAGALLTLEALAVDGRYNNGSTGIPEPVHPIASSRYSVDEPVWSGTAVTLPMQASDGTFDASEESITAQIDTTGWTAGRHLIYVDAEDQDGSRGVPSATFVDVIDPALAPQLTLTVTDLITQQALPQASVVLNDYAFETDASGQLQIQVPADVYDLIISAEDYASLSETELLLQNGDSLIIERQLRPFEILFDDDGETGINGWQITGGWTLSEERALSPTHAWNDSPGASYPNNANATLTSPLIDLSDTESVQLSWHHQYALESGFDYGIVETSIDNGMNWIEQARYNGTSLPADQWQQVQLDVPDLNDQSQVRIRFRLTSDGSVVEDGWLIDDIRIRAPARITDTVFADGFEQP